MKILKHFIADPVYVKYSKLSVVVSLCTMYNVKLKITSYEILVKIENKIMSLGHYSLTYNFKSKNQLR